MNCDKLVQEIKEAVEQAVAEDTSKQDLVYKDDDSVFMHMEELGITVFAYTTDINPFHFLEMLDFIANDVIKPRPSMVEVKEDGLWCDGKFLPESYFGAIVRGATMNNISTLGPLYSRG